MIKNMASENIMEIYLPWYEIKPLKFLVVLKKENRDIYHCTYKLDTIFIQANGKFVLIIECNIV
jgi:hypothetical protein